jgi:hypothetical protein
MVTNYVTNGSMAVDLSRDDQLECYIWRYNPQPFKQNGIFRDLDMTCLDANVTATFKESILKGVPNEVFVDYWAEDGTQTFFELRPLPEDQWLVEDGAVYERYHDSAFC